MRVRRNDIYPHSIKQRQIKKAALKRRFRTEFQELLKSEHYATSNTNFYRTYVRVPDHIDEIVSFRESFSDEILTVTGARGIGKSAAIRYVYNLESSVKIESNRLIIPFYIDNYVKKENFEAKFVNTLSESCDKILKKYNIDLSIADFVSFISENKESILGEPHLYGEIMGIDISPDITATDIKSQSKLVYYIMLLKYLVIEAEISMVTFIADDFESADSAFEFQRDVVLLFLSTRNCLMNTYPYSKNFCVKLMFGNRPATFRMLRGDNGANGYSAAAEHQLSRPAPISEIVKNRIEDVYETINSGRRGGLPVEFYSKGSREKWESSYYILSKIIDQIQDRYGNFLVGLSNFDLRMAFYNILVILDNSNWYEANISDNLEGAFKIEENVYHINDVNIMNCLALESNVYYNSVNSKLPNIFINYDPEESDLISAYLVKMFVTEGANVTYSMFEKATIVEKLSLIFGKVKVDRYIDRILEYFLEPNREILRKEKIDSKIYFISQPAMFYIYNACEKSSAVIQLICEDMYLTKLYKRNDEIVPVALENQENQLIHALEFIKFVADREISILKNAIEFGEKSTIRDILDIFGSVPVCRHLLGGVMNSIRRRFAHDHYPSRIADTLQSVSMKVGECEKLIGGK